MPRPSAWLRIGRSGWSLALPHPAPPPGRAFQTEDIQDELDAVERVRAAMTEVGAEDVSFSATIEPAGTTVLRRMRGAVPGFHRRAEAEQHLEFLGQPDVQACFGGGDLVLRRTNGVGQPFPQCPLRRRGVSTG